MKNQVQWKFWVLKIISKSFSISWKDFFNLFTCDLGMHLEFTYLQGSAQTKVSYHVLSLLEFYKGPFLQNILCIAICNLGQCMASLLNSKYICKKALSTMNINKSKLRARLIDDHLHEVLQIVMSSIESKLQCTVSQKYQRHTSNWTKKQGWVCFCYFQYHVLVFLQFLIRFNVNTW